MPGRQRRPRGGGRGGGECEWEEGGGGGVTINRTLSLIEKLKLLDFNTKTKGEKEIRMIKQEIVFYFQRNSFSNNVNYTHRTIYIYI